MNKDLLTSQFLICLVGLPASGKTTFSKKLKKFIEQNQPNYKVKIIDPDKIRENISPNKFNYEKEQKVRELNLNEIKIALKEGFIVISDDLNYYTSMRHDLKIIAESFNVNFFIIYITTPLEICLKWNKNRGEIIPNHIIKNISTKLDTFDKYKWDSPIVKIDISKVKDYNEIFENLMNIFHVGSENSSDLIKKEGTMGQSSNLYNEMLDKITRQILGEILKKKEFTVLKTQLLTYRKRFIRTNLEMPINKELISKTFKEYLEKNLNINLG